jgi:hypothetical protein
MELYVGMDVSLTESPGHSLDPWASEKDRRASNPPRRRREAQAEARQRWRRR